MPKLSPIPVLIGLDVQQLRWSRPSQKPLPNVIESDDINVLFLLCWSFRLQHVLMDLQQQQLNQLSEWLTRMEAGIKSHPPVGGSEQQVMQQLQTHQVCMQLVFKPCSSSTALFSFPSRYIVLRQRCFTYLLRNMPRTLLYIISIVQKFWHISCWTLSGLVTVVFDIFTVK